jgi:hypothetical protein
LQLSLCCYLCCIIAGEVADTLRQREICAGRRQSEVLCLCVLWRDQVLPDASRSQQFSTLYFSFSNTDRRELRKQGGKTHQISWGYLTLLPVVPSRQTDRWASSTCLTLHQAAMHFKSEFKGWAPVAHVCIPSYSGGRDQEDHGSKPPWANSSWDPISKIPNTERLVEWLEV